MIGKAKCALNDRAEESLRGVERERENKSGTETQEKRKFCAIKYKISVRWASVLSHTIVYVALKRTLL